MTRPNPSNITITGRNRQKGSALVVGLVFLVILTLLGLTASSGGIHQELITRNIKDQNLALYSAESALREAETWLRNSGPLTPLDSAIIKPTGFCGTVAEVCASASDTWWGLNAVKLGDLVGTQALQFVTAPEIIIELYRVKSSCPWCASSTIVNYYRITTRATGINPTTVRILRSLYRW